MPSSAISGFYNLSIEKRLKKLKEHANLTEEEIDILRKNKVDTSVTERMIENVVGTMPIPLGVAVNFLINGRDYLIPMAIEETSVVAACSHGAKIARVKGGFSASSTDPVMIGQLQVVALKDVETAKQNIIAEKQKILQMANEEDPVLLKLGAGAKDIDVRTINTPEGEMLVMHLLVDVRDAMGANAVNTMCEAVAPFIEKLTGGKVLLRIISNLAVYRLARASAVFSKEEVGSSEIIDGIIQAYAFACGDKFRCATHNKGIMNGIDAVLIATGNDFRAVEAGAHAFAALDNYKSLTKYEKNQAGDLVGSIELPLPVGLVGGATAVHPTAKICIKILGVKTARELSEVIAAVGLAQNFAALRALVAEGIQKGHMSLHARNIAVMAGAKEAEIDKVAEILVKEKKIRVDRAKEILDELRHTGEV